MHTAWKLKLQYATHSPSRMQASREYWYTCAGESYPRLLDDPRRLPSRQSVQTGSVDVHQLVPRGKWAVIGRRGAVEHLDHVQAGTEGRTAANTDAYHVILSFDESDLVPHRLSPSRRFFSLWPAWVRIHVCTVPIVRNAYASHLEHTWWLKIYIYTHSHKLARGSGVRRGRLVP